MLMFFNIRMKKSNYQPNDLIHCIIVRHCAGESLYGYADFQELELISWMDIGTEAKKIEKRGKRESEQKIEGVTGMDRQEEREEM